MQEHINETIQKYAKPEASSEQTQRIFAMFFDYILQEKKDITNN